MTAWRPSAVGGAARVLDVAGQQRVDAVADGLRERARVLGGDRRQQAARARGPPGRRTSATAPSARSQPSRRARRTMSFGSRSSRVRSSSRNEPRSDCSVSSRASATATSVSAATAATCRYSPASAVPGPEHQHGAELLAAGDDRHLGRDLAPAARACRPRAARRRSARTAPSPRPACPAAARSPPPARRRGPRAISAIRSSPSPASTAPTISRWAPRGVGRDSARMTTSPRRSDSRLQPAPPTFRMCLQHLLARLAGPDADRLLDGQDEDLAVADRPACARGAGSSRR